MWLQLDRVSSSVTIMLTNWHVSHSLLCFLLKISTSRPQPPFKEDVVSGPVPSLATTSNAVPHFDKKVVRVVNVKSLNTMNREVEISSLSIPNSQGVRVPVPVYVWVRVRARVLVWVWVWVRIRFRVRVLVLFLFLVFLLHLLGMFQVRMAFCFCEGCFLIVCLVWVLCLRGFLQVHSFARVPAGVLEEYWKTIRIV